MKMLPATTIDEIYQLPKGFTANFINSFRHIMKREEEYDIKGKAKVAYLSLPGYVIVSKMLPDPTGDFARGVLRAFDDLKQKSIKPEIKSPFEAIREQLDILESTYKGIDVNRSNEVPQAEEIPNLEEEEEEEECLDTSKRRKKYDPNSSWNKFRVANFSENFKSRVSTTLSLLKTEVEKSNYPSCSAVLKKIYSYLEREKGIFIKEERKKFQEKYNTDVQPSAIYALMDGAHCREFENVILDICCNGLMEWIDKVEN